MPKILGMEPKTFYWVAGGGAALLLLMLVLRRRAGGAAAEETGLPVTTGAPAAASDYGAALANLAAQLQQQQAQQGQAQAAVSAGFTQPGQQISTISQPAHAATPLETTYGRTGQANPALPGSAQKKPACNSGFVATQDAAGNWTCEASAGESTATQKPQCPGGQHWSKKHGRCRKNVNVWNDYVAPVLGFAARGAETAAEGGYPVTLGTVAAGGVGATTGTAGGGESDVSTGNQDQVSATSVRPGTGRRPTVRTPTTAHERQSYV